MVAAGQLLNKLRQTTPVASYTFGEYCIIGNRQSAVGKLQTAEIITKTSFYELR